MSKQPTYKVSVIIPVFNGEKYLKDALQSVIEQTITDLEIIVVDDGSTDGTPAVIKKIESADIRIKSLRQSNRGVSAARNLGYRQSIGEYIAFLDADDVWLPDNLEAKIEKFSNGNFGLVHSDTAVISSSGGFTGLQVRGKEGDLLNDLLAWCETQIPGPSSILLKREVLEKIGLWDERLSTSADQDFFIRVASRFLIGRVPRITWHYRVHDKNMHKNISRMEHDVLYVFDKARHENRFHSLSFQKSCFANMYMILAASLAGDGHNYWRGIRFVYRAIILNPSLIFKLPGRFMKAWLKG